MASRREWIEFKPHERNLVKVLGDLEADIMETVWRLGSGQVRDIHREVNRRRRVAVTTVATVLDRLHGKGLVTRRLQRSGSLHYEYIGAITRKEFEKIVAERVLKGLFEAFGDSAIAYLMDHARVENKKTAEKLRRYFEKLKEEKKL